MPEQKSDRKRLSNLANAEKSTGPRTPEGKARSAQNARKHGLLSKDVVLTGAESTAEFQELLERLYDQLGPEDAIEHALVDRAAACYWRLRRAQRYEVGALRSALHDGVVLRAEDHMENRRRRLDKLRVELRRHQRNLQILHTPEDDLDAIEKEDREEALIRASLAIGQTVRDLSDPAVLEAAIQECKQKIADTQSQMRACEPQTSPTTDDKHDSASSSTSLAMLPEDEELDRLIRYETMLDRQLHRALRELRHRQRRSEPGCPQPGWLELETPPNLRRDVPSGRVTPVVESRCQRAVR
jgi:hypothetical protein